MRGRRSHSTAYTAVAPPLVPLHVTSHAERLTTPSVRTLERLLARVRMAVDLETAGPAERFVARLADVAVLGLREGRLRRWTDVVMVLPRVRGGHIGRGLRHWHGRWRRKVGGEWSLVVEV